MRSQVSCYFHEIVLYDDLLRNLIMAECDLAAGLGLTDFRSSCR